MQYVLALDQGTTSSRAILFDRRGRPVATAQQELHQYYPQPGWVEHDPNEIWSSQLNCARRALGTAGVGPQQVVALGIANQRETTVIWERSSGRPIAHAIVWQDRRTAGVCAHLREQGHEPDLTARTGLLLDPYFSATKIAWLLDRVAGARARAERGELAFGTVDSWLIWNLTGEHVTDVSNASRTSLFNLSALAWDEHLLSLFGVPRSILPRVTASSRIVGRARADLLGAEIAVAGNAGDQQAATFGQACFEPGMAKNTYGTGCFLMANTGSNPHGSANRLLSTVGWQLGAAPPTYLLEGSVFVGGAVVQWVRDGLDLILEAREVETLARQVEDSGGVFLVPAFAGLGAPYWDSDARGAITELRVDGGAASNDLLMQMQADALGVPVVRPAVTETTALGAAYLAGLAVGLWGGVDEISSMWAVDRRFEPATSDDERQERLMKWRRAVERSRHWAG